MLRSMLPIIRARRILNRMSRFTSRVCDPDEHSESEIGIYHNDDGDIRVLTDRIQVRSGHSSQCLHYSDMVSIESVSPSEISAGEIPYIRIVMKDGTSLRVRVDGSRDERFFDVFEFARFLLRVRDDLSEE